MRAERSVDRQHSDHRLHRDNRSAGVSQVLPAPGGISGQPDSMQQDADAFLTRLMAA